MTDTTFRFLHPWLLAALVIPLALLVWDIVRRRRRTAAVLYSDLAFAAGIPVSLRQRFLSILPYVRFLALCLGVLALARPQHGTVEHNVSSLGVDIALVLDVSNSMQQTDYYPTRLEAAKNAAIEFVKSRRTDRISVIIFGNYAGMLLPPTLDMATAEQFIGAIYDRIIDNSATAVGEGLALAVKKMEDSPAKSRVVILLTDGENNSGKITPVQAAEIAKSLDVRVYTIGVGSSFLPNSMDPFGRRIQGGAGFDEDTLRNIAEVTGGRYFRATDEDSLLSIYKEIDQMEKSEIEVNENADFSERFGYFWFPALALIGLEILLRVFWLRRLP